MYSSEDIIWIKNIKRNGGYNWAYDDVKCGKTFPLNWSKEGSANAPSIGEIIVLFQRPNKVNERNNKVTFLTHLVSPISEKAYKNPDNTKHPWCRDVELIAIANPIVNIPNPGYFNFFKPNRGSTNPIINLTNSLGLSEIETKEKIWNLFQSYFCLELSNKIFIPEDPIGIYGELEGDKFIRQHINQEVTNRNSKIVQKAKYNAFIKGKGKILCECCGFDFVSFYGKIGSRFIECHHKIHLSKGERITHTSDLALVCSNCHRMLHRRKEDGTHHNIKTLKELIQSLK